MSSSGTGKLFLVPTPIGNLRDITLRAIDVLKAVDLIVCEDTRRTKILLTAIDKISHAPLTLTLSPPGRGEGEGMERYPSLISLHEHSGPGRVHEIIRRLQEGLSIALVSDSGTPLLSDPGFELVREAVRNKISVEALPGAHAAATAIVVSCLAVDSYSFFGFLHQKSAARKKRLSELKDREETLIFYESPFRLLAVLKEIKEIFGDREACVARELTKKFEEVSRGHLSELVEKFSRQKPRGEIVIVVAGKGRKKLMGPGP